MRRPRVLDLLTIGTGCALWGVAGCPNILTWVLTGGASWVPFT